jgi:SAM-dependent methyltransferase
VSGFSAEWLALREPADSRSRSAWVTSAIGDALPQGRVVRALDLAAGTGSNSRFLKRMLPAPQEWLLVDHDPDLLERARRTIGSDIRTHAMDLSRTGELASVLHGHDFVTASALLDLVSEDWLQAVCAMCRSQRSALLFALSYDGRVISSPEEPEDDLVRSLVNRHQQTDKGFGPALGPHAAARAAEILKSLGYEVVRARSDWVLDRESDVLQRQLIDGWAAAARAIAPEETELIARWRQRRIDHIAGERSRVIVGHEDLGAFMA